MSHEDPIIDGSRSHCLCTAGMPGWAAATLIDADGRESYAVVNMSEIDDETVRFDPAARDIQHEQDDTLPVDVFVRVWSVQ
jgi:hypothetical protein